MPEISVIMGVYNQFNREILLGAVDSILFQTFSDFEFIIYNDGSQPEATKLLRNVANRDRRIKLIECPENKGLGFSLNACIEAASGKYIARMDDDDYSFPQRLLKQKTFLEENPEYSWVGSNTMLFDKNGIWGRRIMPEAPTASDYLKFSPYVHPSVMYRAEIFDKNKGYLTGKDTLRCEDYELFMRFRAKGIKGANLQEFLFAYREDKGAYNKRTFRSRVNEAKCRARNFKKLGIMFPIGWIYIFRPLAACLIPRNLIAYIKHRESDAIS